MTTVNGVPYVVETLSSGKMNLKATYPMNAKGYTLHNTYNDAAAMSEIRYMQTNNNAVSFTFAIDNLRIVQGLPLNRNGWHGGDGKNGYGNRNTWGVEICYSKSGGEKYDKGETNTILFVAHGLWKNGWDISRVWKHKDWSGKNCPHRILARSRGWEGIIAAIQKELNRLKGVKPTAPKSKPPVSKVPRPSTPTKGIDTLAREVIAGKHGSGDARKASLGNRYAEIQGRVNDILRGFKPTRPTKGVDTLAREVIAGKHGTGEKRKQSLGNQYAAVQKRVNELSGVKTSAPTKPTVNVKSLATLLDEVNRGVHGNGEVRKKSLGKDYARVQAAINRK